MWFPQFLLENMMATPFPIPNDSHLPYVPMTLQKKSTVHYIDYKRKETEHVFTLHSPKPWKKLKTTLLFFF
jgi:hypothetical protein